MAVVNQLNLNVGTERNPNFVLHDINDKRISTTAVTTATHILTCNSGVTSIAPITAANLASVLGETTTAITDWDNVPFYGMFSSSSTASNAPAGGGYFTGFQFFNSRHQHTYQVATRSSDLTIYLRVKTSLSGSWGSWKKIESTAIA